MQIFHRFEVLCLLKHRDEAFDVVLSQDVFHRPFTASRGSPLESEQWQVFSNVVKSLPLRQECKRHSPNISQSWRNPSTAILSGGCDGPLST